MEPDSPQPDEAAPAPIRPPGIRIASISRVPVLITPAMLFLVPILGYLYAASTVAQNAVPSAARIAFGVGVVVAIYVTVFAHEIAHALAARRCRLSVRGITLGAFGGSTALGDEPRSPGQAIFVSVVGPLTSVAIGLAFVAVRPSITNTQALDADFWLIWANLFVGLLNLLPALPLDGGQILHAIMWKFTGSKLRGTVITGWIGRVVAIALLIAAVVSFQADWLGFGRSFFVAFGFIGLYVWIGSTASVARVRLRRRLPDLKARPLARGVLAVPEDLSIAEAVRRAQDVGAGGIVTHTSDERLTGIVSEAALNAVPVERRPWLAVSTVTRALEDGLVLPSDLAGEDLVLAISRTPAEEYVLVDSDGEIYGLLSTADVDRAFAETVRGRKPTGTHKTKQGMTNQGGVA